MHVHQWLVRSHGTSTPGPPGGRETRRWRPPPRPPSDG